MTKYSKELNCVVLKVNYMNSSFEPRIVIPSTVLTY